ncbi:MAG TPA: hypothetical protein VFO03_14115 [Gaiellaceae bacterium]|nr:hypothetical protein [Gaiellaceae bacterium]
MDDAGRAEVDEGPPAPVFLALIGSYALGATLLAFGFLGFLTWAAVGDVVGVGATLLGLLVVGATYIAWRGSRAGRALIGLLAAIGTVAGVIYAFAGPSSAIIPSLVVAALGAGTIALLFLPESSKRFYAAA